MPAFSTSAWSCAFCLHSVWPGFSNKPHKCLRHLPAVACRLYSEVPKLLASIKELSLLSSPALLCELGMAELAQAVLHCEAVMQQLLQPRGMRVPLGMLDVLAHSTPHRWAPVHCAEDGSREHACAVMTTSAATLLLAIAVSLHPEHELDAAAAGPYYWLGNSPCKPAHCGLHVAIMSALRAAISQPAGAGKQQPSGVAEFHDHSLACLLKLFKMLLKASLSAGSSEHLASMQAMLINKAEVKPNRSASLLWSLVNMLTGECSSGAAAA